jgi:MoxR-like ATPase
MNNIFLNLKNEISKIIVGQTYLVDRLIVALLAGGHVLLEGVPGLAKTRSLSALAQCLGVDLKRVQFTPDLLPADLIGTQVYRPNTGDFVTRQGPIFTNILLADEINRAPAKVQSALLQAMQEHKVTIGDNTYDLPAPFFVLATQNPIEQEGTYPLPEAQMDRFLMKVNVTYPSFEEELEILKLTANEVTSEKKANKILSAEDYVEIGSLHDRHKKAGVVWGDWVKPIWPVRSTTGSVPTPYIFDDRVDFEDISPLIMDWYKMPKEDREAAGLKGRKHFLGEGKLSREAMCQSLVDGMEGAFANWKPKQKFKLIEL